MPFKLAVLSVLLSCTCLAGNCSIFDPNYSPFSEESVLEAAVHLEKILTETMWLRNRHHHDDEALLKRLSEIVQNQKGREYLLEAINWDQILQWRRVFEGQKITDKTNGKLKINNALEAIQATVNTVEKTKKVLSAEDIKFINEHIAFHPEARLEKIKGLPDELIEKLPHIYLKIAQARSPHEVAESYNIEDHIHGTVWKYKVSVRGTAYRIVFMRRNGINYIASVTSHEEYNGKSGQTMITNRLRSMGF